MEQDLFAYMLDNTWSDPDFINNPFDDDDSSEESQIDLPKIMSYSEFKKYLQKKIVPDRSILVTKEMLIKVDQAFYEEFGKTWIKLTRDDKRLKEKIFQKMYKNVNIIFSCIQKEPDKYLKYVKELIIAKYINKTK